MAKHRVRSDKLAVDRHISAFAQKIEQLTSDNPEHSLSPMVCPLITDICLNAVFKCDWHNKSFEEIKTPAFNFMNHSTVQVGMDLFAIQESNVAITRIENLLTQYIGV